VHQPLHHKACSSHDHNGCHHADHIITILLCKAAWLRRLGLGHLHNVHAKIKYVPKRKSQRRINAAGNGALAADSAQ